MTLQARRRTWIIAALLAVALAAVMYYAGAVLIPFIVGLLLAYLLDPAVQRLTAAGLPRRLAALLVTLFMVALVAALLSALGPLVYGQMMALFKTLPALITDAMREIQHRLAPYSPMLRQAGLGNIVKPSTAQAASSQADILASLLTGGMAFIEVLGLSLLTPVLTYYLLADWDRLIDAVDRMIPDAWHHDAVELARRIDYVLSGFFRGQAWVCAILSVVYSAGLVAVGLQYGFVIGILSGIFKFVPYIGTAAGLTLGLVAGLTQPGFDGLLMGGILGTYAIAEALESGFLTPRLVGRRVSLHPVVVILSILLGGQLFGMAGVFFAVPVIAVARVLVTFALWRNGIPVRDKMARPVSPSAGPESDQAA